MLSVRNVSKFLDGKKVLNNINLEIKKGDIFGFLGPNGAGKSTTMKIICGLLEPDEGAVIINNRDIVKERISAIKELSALIETPKMYPYLSAIENLKQLSRIDNISDAEVEQAISLVGLKNKEMYKVKTYSLGMKQKLGIAQVIMGNKKLLILDEPTNGLNASGIVEFRNIVKNLSIDKGVTVFISSHKLDEIEKLCNRVAFINSGEIKSVENINFNEDSTYLEIFTTDKDKCLESLKGLNYINKIMKSEYGVILEYNNDHFEDIMKNLVFNHIVIKDVKKKLKTLEERYLELMGDVLDD